MGCEVTLVSDASPCRVSSATIWPASSPPPPSGADCGWSAAEEPALSTHGAGTRVVLADGTELEADLVVTAIGDEPNIGWLAGSDLLVDGSLCASIPAAGSGRTLSPPVTWRFSRPAAGWQRVPLWTSAIDQAKVAAVGLLKGDAAPEFNFQPYFWTEGFGLSLKSVGFTPVAGTPDYCEPGGELDSMLLRWENADGSGTAAAINYRIPIPKLRRLANAGPAALRPAAPARL